jgi:predicted nucleic acid-binding protein
MSAFHLGADERTQATAGAASLAHPAVALHGRIRGFNVFVAHVWAEQERLLDKAGRRMAVEDSYIAAIALRHGLTIATGNDRHFKGPGLNVFNPFKEFA